MIDNEFSRDERVEVKSIFKNCSKFKIFTLLFTYESNFNIDFIMDITYKLCNSIL